MAAGYKSANVDFDDLFDPDIVGDGPTATDIKSGGVLLRYAALSYGTKRADVGYAINGVDVSNRWAAKGTAQYALGFNDAVYVSTRTRATASLTLNMKADGTWSIVRQQGFGSETLLASGAWLIAGGTAADYTVKFDMKGFISGPDEGGGSDDYSNDAPTPSALTSTRQATASAVAVTVGNNAANDGTIDVYLYKSGVLISSSTCTFNCTSAG